MHDQAIHRCINEACGRPAPRPVNYCPWCGTAQARAGAQGSRPAPAAGAPQASAAAAAAAVAAAGASAAAVSPPPASPAAQPPAAAPSATDFGRGGKPGATRPPPSPPAPPPPRQEVPRPPLAAHPPQRSPIRLRWWILALALLWGVWLVAKPSSKKIDRQIDAAIAMARECKGSEAQAELIALRKTRASQAQLQRLQQALNDEAARCTRQRQRAKAWGDASNAVEAALAATSWDKAKTRLQAFTRRWGEDEDTRALKDRIDTARREDETHRAHPLAVPPSAVGSSGGGATGAGGGRSPQAAAESARNLVQSAERDLDRGDIGAAIDKMTLCLTMVDAGNPECRALKTQAEQQGRFQ